MFMGKPIRKAPVFAVSEDAREASRLGRATRMGSERARRFESDERAVDPRDADADADADAEAASDGGSDANSASSPLEKAVERATGMFGGFFGGGKDVGNPKTAATAGAISKRSDETTREGSAVTARGAAKPRDAAVFFHLDPATTFRGAFSCALRDRPGHLYVFDYHVGFAALDLRDDARWHAPAKTVTNLEIVGVSTLAVGLSTGLHLDLDAVDDRDAAYECLVSMLEKVPQSPGEEVHGEPDARIATPLRLGFEGERFVFVHVAQATGLPESAIGSVAIATAALGRFGAAATSAGPTLRDAPSRFGRTFVFPASEADLAADAVVAAVAGGGVGDSGFGSSTLGEAHIPLAMLPRDRAGAAEVKANPYTVGLRLPGEWSAAGGSRAPSSKAVWSSSRGAEAASAGALSAARSVGALSVAAWIGTTLDLLELGDLATIAEPAHEDSASETSAASQAAARVPPAVSRVTITAHRVRGVFARRPGGSRVSEPASNEPTVELTCRLKLGGQTSFTAFASHSSAAQADWGGCARRFIAAEPRGGALAVDVALPDGSSLGRVDVDISSLPMRPAKGSRVRARWLRLRRPPASASASVSASASSARASRGESRGRGESRRSEPESAALEKPGDGFFVGVAGLGFNIGGTVSAKSEATAEDAREATSDSESDDARSESDAEGAANADSDDAAANDDE
jgi:hypothetical protein